MDYKQSKAPSSTITYDKATIESKTGNIYEAINIVAKRANQINQDIKKELLEKLEEFATTHENLDEVFENKGLDYNIVSDKSIVVVDKRLNLDKSSHRKQTFSYFIIKR